MRKLIAAISIVLALLAVGLGMPAGLGEGGSGLALVSGQTPDRIQVTSSPPGATFLLLGPEIYAGTTPWSVSSAPAGNYCIYWDDMPGYATPIPSCQDVSDNGTATFNGDYQPITGAIQVTSSPSGATFTLTGPETYAGTTPWGVSDAPVGNYCIVWDGMPGYAAPDPSCQDVSENGTATFNGGYQLITGTIQVTSSPPGATFALTGPETYAGTAPWNVNDAPVGNYCISWDDMSGYVTPDPSCQDVSENTTTIFNGGYQVITGPEMIQVTSSPSGAPFLLIGPQTYMGATPWGVSDAPAGNYCVYWGSMPGYTAPDPFCQDVSENGTTVFNGHYQPITGTGTIQVTSSPPGASFLLTGPETYAGTTPWGANGVPVGNYCIYWGSMPGYTTPDPSCQDVSDNGTATFNGHYQQIIGTGTIQVTSVPSGATFLLTGPETYAGTTPWSVNSAPAGNYCIFWDDLPGYITPGPSCQSLAQNGTIAFAGGYVPTQWQYTFEDLLSEAVLHINPDDGVFLFIGGDGFISGVLEGTPQALGEGRTMLCYRDSNIAVACFVDANTESCLAIMFDLASMQPYVVVDIPSLEEFLDEVDAFVGNVSAYDDAVLNANVPVLYTMEEYQEPA